MVQESLLQIVAASTFAIVAAALECHVNEANRRGWTLPSQLAKGLLVMLLCFVSLMHVNCDHRNCPLSVLVNVQL